MVNYCSVYGCLNNSKSHPTVTFHRLPKNEARCHHWLKVIKREDLLEKDLKTLRNTYRVCGVHFESSEKLNKCLQHNAVPRKYLPGASFYSQDIEHRSKCTQTDTFYSSVAQTSCTCSFENQIRPSKECISDLSQTLLKSSENTHRKLEKLIQIHSDLKTRNKGNRVDHIDKMTIWLMDQMKSDETKALGIKIVFDNEKAFPEIANHPDLLQQVLKPREGSVGILSENHFQNTIKPLIIKLFKSNEARVRLKLLDCFSDYVHTFTEEELILLLLPEILKGMKDINKSIVRATLLCLAHLVDILGPQTVIGGTRQELFVFNEVEPRGQVDEIGEIEIEMNEDSAHESDCEIISEEILKKDTQTKKRYRKKEKRDSETECDSANESDDDKQREIIKRKLQKKAKHQFDDNANEQDKMRDRKKENHDSETQKDSANESDNDKQREINKRKCKRKAKHQSDDDSDTNEIDKNRDKKKENHDSETERDDDKHRGIIKSKCQRKAKHQSDNDGDTNGIDKSRDKKKDKPDSETQSNRAHESDND